MSRRVALPVIALLVTFVAATAFAVPAIGVSGSNLVRFDTAAPTTITSTIPITGLTGGDTIVGLDFRPATSQIFALGSGGRLYTIDPNSGAATLVATVSTALSGTAFGTDFNPTVDRFRVVSDADQNLRIVPDTGVATVDVTLQYAATDVNVGANPNVTAVAYTNNFAGATSTTLFGIDTNLDILVTQNPPNNGTLNTVGALGVNTSAVTGFDIDSTGAAFAALQVGTATNIYSINLTTGAATLIGAVGGGTTTLSAFTTAPAAIVGTGIPALSPGMMMLLAGALVAIAVLVLKR